MKAYVFLLATQQQLKQLEIPGKRAVWHHSTNTNQNKKYHDIKQLTAIIETIHSAMKVYKDFILGFQGSDIEIHFFSFATDLIILFRGL